MCRFTKALLEARTALFAGVTALALAWALPAFAIMNWPDLPAPPKAKVQWVAQMMKINGVPTRVQTFQSEVSKEEVVEFFRSHWTGGSYDHAATVKAYGSATVVGQMHGPYLLTAKIVAGEKGTSTGILSIAQIGGSKVDHSPGIVPLMPGATVAQVVESDDPGKHSRQVTIVSTASAASASRYYQAHFLSNGWMQVQGSADATAQSRTNPGAFYAFSRPGKEMQVSIAPLEKGRGTVVLANLVTKDTGPGFSRVAE